jgi:glycosyltransferase involved in cell wall biosynthesis
LKHRVRLLVFAPLYGQGGDVMNEGQLINALSRYVESIYYFTFVSFHRIFLKKAPKPAISLNKNIKVITLPELPLSYIFMLVNIFYYMLIGFIYVIIDRLIKSDIIYIRGRLIASSLLALKSLISKPIVIKFDNFAIDEVLPIIKQKQLRSILGKLLWTIDYYTLCRADLLLVHSNVMKSLIVKRSSIEGHKILICPPGVDTKKIEVIKKSEVSSVGGRIRIGFIGSLVWWQGVDLLAQAMTIIKKQIPEAELFIVGDGPLRKRVIEICKLNDINFKITGYVPHDVALTYLKSFDILVIPRRRTFATESNIPIKVVEAWALGIPTIVTSLEVFKSICRNGEDVLFVKPSPKDIAEKILLLVLKQELKEKLARNGQILARKFDYNEIAKNLLNSILAERKKRYG